MNAHTLTHTHTLTLTVNLSQEDAFDQVELSV